MLTVCGWGFSFCFSFITFLLLTRVVLSAAAFLFYRVFFPQLVQTDRSLIETLLICFALTDQRETGCVFIIEGNVNLRPLQCFPRLTDSWLGGWDRGGRQSSCCHRENNQRVTHRPLSGFGGWMERGRGEGRRRLRYMSRSPLWTVCVIRCAFCFQDVCVCVLCRDLVLPAMCWTCVCVCLRWNFKVWGTGSFHQHTS